jgi:23S rRNA (cytidine1920-2'-O)/16S rRNA (cytidine1409-2'-O)-methyltransferase
VAGCARGLGASVLGFASSGLPGPKGNRESFVWLAEAGRAGDVGEELDAAAREVEP